MRVIVQRVSEASIQINREIYSSIKEGLLILLGVESSDNCNDVLWLTKKISSLRIFSDKNGKMNKSINDIDGEILVVSQFTLHAKTKKGNRPSYIKAAKPKEAIPLYERFIQELSLLNKNEVRSGKFGADMKVQLINDGPVTIIMDSKFRGF
ncbi:MAG: D-tyrosyl-tRNA(Tyr) deacylase [Flavobacteriales bacterium]|nr:D-tyrosyl-tRNA(Tyr) deacylase [Flavobacteriales bacterium]